LPQLVQFGNRVGTRHLGRGGQPAILKFRQCQPRSCRAAPATISPTWRSMKAGLAVVLAVDGAGASREVVGAGSTARSQGQ
jgi:hypothetical protein